VSDSFFDKLIADLVKGAELNSRANGGPGVNILIDRENHGHEEKLASAIDRVKQATLTDNYTLGVKAAATAFGVKEAFLGALLPMAGSMLGGGALRKGVGALAGGAGGKALGGMAGKILPKMTGGMGGFATDAIGSMAGGALGQKLAPPQPPQPPQPGM
jgi:hypothetical protein